MADPLYDLLQPYTSIPIESTPSSTAYLSHLTTLPLSSLTTTEPESISNTSQTLLRSIQSLARRSHKSIARSSSLLSSLSTDLPQLTSQTTTLTNALPSLDSKAAVFAEKYRKLASTDSSATNSTLIARQNALRLARNADRLLNILELPTLLSSAVSASSASSSTSAITSSTISAPVAAVAVASATAPTSPSAPTASVNYGSALDLHAHTRRLLALYPSSALIASIAASSDTSMAALTAALIAALRAPAPALKLAAAMRIVGWLRRVAPELDSTNTNAAGGRGTGSGNVSSATAAASDGVLGALVLAGRLAGLSEQLHALEPLRELALQESTARIASARATATTTTNTATTVGKGPQTRRSSTARPAIVSGQQTERYLKRWIEIFREQSFAIVSMYQSIFPSALSLPVSVEGAGTTKGPDKEAGTDVIPSPLATYVAHLVDMLFDTLREYLPNVSDQASRDSLMTQVLYCAGSLGRLGGDFSMMIALLEEDLSEQALQEGISASHNEEDADWVKVMKKHRVQASRLELLASGVGASKTAIGVS